MKKVWRSLELSKWGKWHEFQKRPNGEKFVRAWLTPDKKSGGFYISSKLADELRERIGNKRFAEIYYGFNSEGTIVILFEFNDDSGYAVPPLYKGHICARSLIEHLNLQGKTSDDYIIDGNKLVVFFREDENTSKGENRVVFGGQTEGDIVLIEKVSDWPCWIYKIDIATTCQALIIEPCHGGRDFIVIVWDCAAVGVFAKKYRSVEEFEKEFDGTFDVDSNTIIVDSKFVEIVRDLVENEGVNIFRRGGR